MEIQVVFFNQKKIKILVQQIFANLMEGSNNHHGVSLRQYIFNFYKDIWRKSSLGYLEQKKDVSSQSFFTKTTFGYALWVQHEQQRRFGKIDSGLNVFSNAPGIIVTLVLIPYYLSLRPGYCCDVQVYFEMFRLVGTTKVRRGDRSFYCYSHTVFLIYCNGAPPFPFQTFLA